MVNFPVEVMAKKFKLKDLQKLELDYNKPRKKGHRLTKNETEYIKNDILIPSTVLKMLFDENLTKMTQGSNALHDYKQILSVNKFNHFFPALSPDCYKELKQSYKGGFTYLSPEYTEKDVGEGVTLDVNSLYPYCMYTKPLPISDPIYYEGEYNLDKVYDLYIQCITCSFVIKENKIPTIQIKHTLSFMDNEYLTSSNNELVTLYLTNVDLKLFFEHYNVYELKFNYGWKFRSSTCLFKDYIDKWMAVKVKSTIDGNEGLRQISKIMLNSLYGKFRNYSS